MKFQQPIFKIQIPQPCSQSWDEMGLEVGGRHCAACAKTVVDFTRMSDAQILETLKKNASGCGRFKEDQLGRELAAPPAGRRFSFASFYRLAASLLLVFTAGKAIAQERKEIPTEETPLKIPQKGSSYISGFVTDEEGEPLTGAKIEVKGYDTAFIAGIDGEFRMEIPDSTFQKVNVEISVFFPGYKIEEMILSRENFPLHLQATLVRDLKESKNKGGFEVIPIPQSDRTKLTEADVERMGVRELSSIVGTISGVLTNAPHIGEQKTNNHNADELRNKERELQYKQRENRSSDFIHDYGH